MGTRNLYKDYRDLEGWFWNHRREDFRKRYKLKIRRALNFRRVRISGHEGKSFSIPIRRGLLKKEIGQIDSYIWYCPNMSRIHVLTLSKITDEIPFLPAKEYENTPTETFNKILASVSCHFD